MADAQKPADKPMTEPQALWQAGWIKPVDVVLFVTNVFCVAALVLWAFLGDPPFVKFVLACTLLISEQILWVIMLIFRCSYFVLKLHADVSLMPTTAARMVVSYYQQAPIPGQ